MISPKPQSMSPSTDILARRSSSCWIRLCGVKPSGSVDVRLADRGAPPSASTAVSTSGSGSRLRHRGRAGGLRRPASRVALKTCSSWAW